jgi:hypothetical protein
LFIHLIHDISPLIKLSFNTPKSTMGLDALSPSIGFCFAIFTLCNGCALTYKNSMKLNCIIKILTSIPCLPPPPMDLER